MPGVTVNVYAGACPASGPIIGTDTTDANGEYLVNGLLAGDYCVVVPAPGTDGVPAGYSLTGDPDGGAATLSYTATLLENEERTDVDFGYQPGGAGVIGDQLFEDVNNNGSEGATEPPITTTVTIELYEDSNGNGVIDTGDLLIDTTATNPADGTYSFTGLDPNLNYIVKVDEADPDLAAYFSPDAFVNTTGAVQPVSPQDFIDSSNNYVDADFGYFALVPSSIGDEVCIDSNNDGSCAGEELLPGVTVNLYLDGDLIATTTTSITGTYSFEGLGPGDYTVAVDTTDPDIPGGYFPSVNNIPVSLGVGDDRTDIDFPFVQLISKEVDKTDVTDTGETLTYTITANYPGNELLTDVVVTDSIPAGTTYVADSDTPEATVIPLDDATATVISWTLGSNIEGAPAFAGSAAGTNSLRAVQDAKLQINNPTNNYGGDTTIQVKTPDTTDRRTLVKYNVTSLAGQTVSSATLRFYVSNNGAANTRIDVYPVTHNWDSTGTTWNNATAATAWTKPGGDYNTGNLLGSFTPSVNNQYYTVSGAAVDALVQSWIDNSAANYGVILVMVGVDDEVQIRSVEEATVAERPELEVTTGSGTTTRNPSQDTYIQQANPTNNYATSNPLRVLNSPDEQRAALQWDVSSLPPAAEVVNASVKLYFTGGNSKVRLNLYQAAKTWNEASATWMLAQTADPWAIPGGDYTTSLGSFVAPSTNNTYKSYSSTELKTLVPGLDQRLHHQPGHPASAHLYRRKAGSHFRLVRERLPTVPARTDRHLPVRRDHPDRADQDSPGRHGRPGHLHRCGQRHQQLRRRDHLPGEDQRRLRAQGRGAFRPQRSGRADGEQRHPQLYRQQYFGQQPRRGLSPHPRLQRNPGHLEHCCHCHKLDDAGRRLRQRQFDRLLRAQPQRRRQHHRRRAQHPGAELDRQRRHQLRRDPGAQGRG